MKKLFALIVAICATTLAWADDIGSCGENVIYIFVESTGTLTISGTGWMTDYDYYGHKKNDEYAPWYEYKSAIKKVVIENGVISIGDYAFEGCAELTSINIPSSVTSIGDYAFDGCKGLETITVESGNTRYYSDGNCLIETSTNELILGCNNSVIPNGVTSIGSSAFEGCKGLTSVTIPNSVTSIGSSAFEVCTGLTSVTIPNSVTSIGGHAFAYCTELTNITIPSSVASIGSSAFQSCTGITSITIPSSVTSIGDLAFYGCKGLETITVESGNTKYYSDGNCLIETSTNELILGCNNSVIPNGVTSIRSSAFDDCTGLTSITIPSSVTSIGSSAFYGCTGLEAISVESGNTKYYSDGNCLIEISTKKLILGCNNSVIPNYIASIGSSAFYGCTGLTSITIPNSVTSIGNKAFYNVKHIIYKGNATGSPWGAIAVNGYVDGDFVFSDVTKTQLAAYIGNGGDVSIPSSVTSIGALAFSGCTGLTSINIPNSVTSIGGDAFSGCDKLTYNTYGNANYLGNDSNPYLYLYNTTGQHIPSCKISENCKFIGAGAFYGCTGLTSLTIPNSVTSIGGWAFEDCTGLTSITIPNSVTSIGSSAFSGCDGLTSINIPNSVMSIGSYTFYGCSRLKSVTIPNSVISIGERAFEDCLSLESITIEAITPPYCEGYDGLNLQNYDIMLYVPAVSIDAYKAADEWKRFTNIQAIPNVGVKEATAEKREVKKIIDRNGIIYIEKDGTRYFLNGGKVE